MDTETYVLTCYRYIEMNPVRAGIVAKPSDYHWSSHRYNALDVADEVIDPHVLYTALGGDTISRCRAYRELFCEELDSAILQRIRESLNQEVVLGNDHFREHIENILARRAKPGRRGRPSKKQEKTNVGLG